MARKTVSFTQKGISKLPDDKPVVYKIFTAGGKTNYAGSAKRGRVQDRLQEHPEKGRIPGAKVQIQRMNSIKGAEKTEQRVIARSKPKYNKTGK